MLKRLEVITGKILKTYGWPEGKIIGLAKSAAEDLAKTGLEQDAILVWLDGVREEPGKYLADPTFAALARECLRRSKSPYDEADDIVRDQPASFAVWGENLIEGQAVAQMENAMRLPVAVQGALMPDAHVGYGLPIGGVLAADDAVIPYAVGVDIGCRMRLSIYDISPIVLGQRRGEFRNALLDRTRFGLREGWDQRDRPDHPVLDDPAWEATRLLKSLKIKAQQQLGTSGSGNHFVEWGAFRLYADDEQLGLNAGEYLALLSHSGSRGVGFKIANTYTELASREHPRLDASLRHLAWLSLSSEAGQEYWLSMELAGRFASANHAVIHQRVAAAMKLRSAAVVENFHNFAWLEDLSDGSRAVVHRKGATPAGVGVLGIIPGSMGDAGYVVRGRGAEVALNSASHGAGRRMSRRAAFESITKTVRDAYLRERGVTLLGGNVDESPQAYKDIETVVAAQSDLIDVLGKFTPRLVRMAEEAGEF
ncbi:MAG TPA: RtcB family protein [Ktedonobacterales bacterium]|nr:RtcB family protein [Ktedonobacterales bacterium]